MKNFFDVAILGAGPAGSAAAIELALEGFSVAMLEKEHFPRHKVCGEFLSEDGVARLRRWNLEAPLLAAGVETIDRGALYLPGGAGAQFSLPCPALGVSRFLLDNSLAREAGRRGAELFFGVLVKTVEGNLRDGFQLEAAGGEVATVRARAVLAAWGRRSSLDVRLGREFTARTSGRFFGWKRHYTGDAEHLAGRIHLYIFPGGYCGLSRTENARINFAGVVEEEALRRSGGGWDNFTRALLASHGPLRRDLGGLFPAGPFLGSETIFFEKHSPLIGDILAIGDAAGMRDPFAGNGQATALRGGVLAAELLRPFLRGETGAPELKQTYARAWRKHFSRRFAADAVLRRAVLHAPLPRLLLLLLRPFLPRLARVVSGP